MNLDFTGFSGSLICNNDISINGNLTLSPTCTFSSASNNVQFFTSSSATIMCNGNSINARVVFGNVTAKDGSWTLLDDFKSGTNVNTNFLSGTFNANNKNVTIPGFQRSTGTFSCIINMGSGTWTTTGSGTVWLVQSTTGLIINPGTSTIKVTNVTGTPTTFSGAGFAYYNIWIIDTSTNFTIVGNNTFNDFKVNPGKTILFTAGSMQIVSTFSCIGTLGNLITLNSTTTSPYTLSAVNGSIVCDYLNIQHCIATGGATWYAGFNSINNQSIVTAGSGWLFVAPLNPYTFIAKPGTSNYTNIDTQGKQQYDEPDIVFDQATVFYDSINLSQYTNITKPGPLSVTWQQETISWSSASFPWQGNVQTYTLISKPT